MKRAGFSIATTRRQLFAGSLALAANAVSAQKYAPRIICNMYYWVQLFSTPFRYISSNPDPSKGPRPAPKSPQPTGGMVWTEEQWNTALSDVQYAGYRRTEFVSGTV